MSFVLSVGQLTLYCIMQTIPAKAGGLSTMLAREPIEVVLLRR